MRDGPKTGLPRLSQVSWCLGGTGKVMRGRLCIM